MRKLQIKDIYFGKIDGYNEFLEYGQDTCKGLFYEFPNIDDLHAFNLGFINDEPVIFDYAGFLTEGDI